MSTLKGLGLTSLLGQLDTFTPSSTVEEIKITDVTPLASYTWLDERTPTLVVPGDPPTWACNPTRVPADKGMRYIHQNSARMGPDRSPLEPVFIAMEAMGKKDEPKQHDYVSDRNSLRKLLRWATGVAGKDPFRIDVELAGETILLCRVEEKDVEYISGFWGFGVEYVKAAVKWPKGSEKGSCHHRISSMNFGGLKMLIRHELDGRIPDTGVSHASKSTGDIESLTTGLAALSTTTATTKGRTRQSSSDAGDVSVIRGIKVVKSKNEMAPQASLLEIKTRVSHKEIDWNETYPQLFLSQTPWLYVAKHTKGLFGNVQKYPLDGIELQAYAKKAERAISKLRDVLEDIQDAVKNHGKGRKLMLACINGQLGLYERKEGMGKDLPEEFLEWFDE